jgi:hypothetical protein
MLTLAVEGAAVEYIRCLMELELSNSLGIFEGDLETIDDRNNPSHHRHPQHLFVFQCIPCQIDVYALQVKFPRRTDKAGSKLSRLSKAKSPVWTFGKEDKRERRPLEWRTTKPKLLVN